MPSELIKLRDRIGLLSDDERHRVLQRLTWTMRQPSAVMAINEAIDDIEAYPQAMDRIRFWSSAEHGSDMET